MKVFQFSIALFSLIILTNCQQEKQAVSPKSDAEVAQELAQTWGNYIEISNNGDIDSMMTFFTEDFINWPSYNSTQTGLGELKTMFKSYFENNTSEITDYQQSEVFVHGDMAYEFAKLEQNVTPNGNEMIVVKQRCISVFHKQNDGRWKFYRWMGQQ
jgi:ketosteroid isomerase-like protein